MSAIDLGEDITGDAATALSWIDDSSLDEEIKEDLRAFVRRFPDLTFYKETDAYLDGIEKRDGVTFPAWFRAIRTTLAFVAKPVEFQVDGFDGPESPRAEYPERIWYGLALGTNDEDETELLYEQALLYPIIRWTTSDRSILAIALDDPDDHRILEYSSQDLWDDDADGRPVRESVSVGFDSLPSLLGHIQVLRTSQDGPEIGAV